MGFHVSAEWRERLACPQCHAGWEQKCWNDISESKVECPCCGVSYEISDGISNFGVADAFYDEHGFTRTGRNFSSDLLGRLGLYYARQHYLYDIARLIPAGSAVIELGCGGGSRYLASRYDMLGVEISAQSVHSAARAYTSVVQATAATLPVKDLCVDAIISSFILEHLDDNALGPSLAEMSRVLKPRGFMVHYFDLDTDGPFWAWAKQRPWYDSIFVESKGHYGLRPWEEWCSLFDQAGFEILRSRFSCKTWVQDFSIWSALASPVVSGLPHFAGKAAGALGRVTGPAGRVTTTILQDVVEPWLPDRWAAKVVLQLRKRA